MELLDVHKSLGMMTLMLILPRILYRLFSRVSPEPADSSPLTRAAAKIVHTLLYVLMLIMPVSG
jgi:cytochrome b561